MTWLLSALGLGGIGAALLFIPGALPLALKAFTALWGALCSYPREAAIVALLCLSGWLWVGWDNEVAAHKADNAANVAASAANHDAQVAQVKAAEAKSAQIAKEADNAHTIQLADARSATDRYADAHRLPAKGGICPAGPTAQGNDPGVPAEMPADPDMVAVPRTDLQALTEWVAFGVAAHNQAVAKIEAGQAKAGD